MTHQSQTRTTPLRAAMLVGLCAAGSAGFAQPVTEDFKIVAFDGAADDSFGHAVAFEDGVIAVGARHDDDNGQNSGSAYLYDGSTGTLIAKLLPSDGAAGDRFGFSIAMGGGVVAVGAPGHSHGGIGSGAAYLFDASTGVQLAKLVPEDAEAGDEFGNSIAIDTGVVAVGAWRADEHGDASGAAYLFDASAGVQLDKLLPETGDNFQTFGVSIAIDGGTVAVGSRTYFVLGEGFTFARVHLFDAATGDSAGTLRAGVENYNGDQGGRFGDAVDIDSGLVVVGAPDRNVFFDHSGAAYVFDADSGEQLEFIFPADGRDRDRFGTSVSIEDGDVVIGAEGDDDSAWSGGSAYLFEAMGGAQIEKLRASDGAPFGAFGTAVAIENGVVAVGAIGDSENGSGSGSVYVFRGGGGLPCNDADLAVPFGVLDLGDAQAFVEAFLQGDALADIDGDGLLDLGDVQAFVQAFGDGCSRSRL